MDKLPASTERRLETTRKLYHAPKLVVHGSVAQLTAASGQSGLRGVTPSNIP